ncbi:TIGR03756 family integrating conjugative element protein [Serratia ficaria]|uniref:TIGR03756 family integrating conjugative element protein n=1 Tax=Serratia ficaria TaxID=61651 RepID=UPI0021771F4D|nr:TIGR03756 family integrating conjugative element protein [Serratia ficaria]CAI1200041.1 integrating conjugative element protein, PFL_4710 family [Serratia ficaria]CAI1248768.1 integrating conjugative element protein, PFL_4710 family [Serratia ficaria]CAI2020985.1 integrating conjugative element protein, PFL_4710 family [Serratia ficaria]CAI2527659.1 integrating conjugative element protein, PFL_4710 family [Serratia ficaria]CAI2536157.1 integrating conjugative element protein, PFL_4710 famil
MKRPHRLRAAIAALMIGTVSSAFALNTATITASALSPDCMEYRVVGICYWLFCSAFGCSVRTSVKVRHYIPDAVVSSYTNTGESPWVEVRTLSAANPTAQAGGDGTTSSNHENNLSKFKNADVIGHPAGSVFGRFAAASGYTCEGAGTAFMPYLLSTLDTVAWRYNVPEAVYPEALVPGMREIGTRTSTNLWGAVYPRGGFLYQTDDYRSGAVVAQRAGDIVTRRGQVHVYQPLLANARDGYWPAGELIEGDASTGKWQELTPTLSSSCAVFPHSNAHVQAPQGDYAWALWRSYSCCQRRGQTFLGSVDFN